MAVFKDIGKSYLSKTKRISSLALYLLNNRLTKCSASSLHVAIPGGLTSDWTSAFPSTTAIFFLDVVDGRPLCVGVSEGGCS